MRVDVTKRVDAADVGQCGGEAAALKTIPFKGIGGEWESGACRAPDNQHCRCKGSLSCFACKARKAMQVWQACHKHQRKHINGSPAAAVGREKKPGGKP